MNGENYQLLRSSMGVMTFFKFLIIFGGMLLAAGISGQAATTTDDTAEVTGTPTTETHKTHHKKHHRTASTESATTNSATASTSGTTTESESKTSTTKSDGNSSDQNAEADKTATVSTTGKTRKSKKTHTAKTETATSGKTSEDNQTHSAQGEKSTAASVDKTATTSTDKTPASTTPPSSAGAAAAAATVVNGQTAVATGKSHHRHHGKAASETIIPPPEPPIVITTVNVPPMSSVPNGPAASNSIVPTVETGLPVPRPGAGTTATLPIAMIRNPVAPPVNTHFTFTDEPSRPRTRTYPWKSNIVTTVFWIGEGSTPLSSMTNKMSAWDMNWVHDNGGADDQYDMSGYASGSHASLINPFYVALPFNDLAYPDKTERWLPSGWYKATHHGDKPVSACQGRWIEIKNRAGRTCFAQWEDVGPINTDDAEYVFGSAPPSASRGLDVSPAVAKYLGIDSTALTSWRFVDDDDVQPGMWLRYNEQAILFQALKDQARRSTPINDLSQPVPDGSEDDANQKKIRAGRG